MEITTLKLQGLTGTRWQAEVWDEQGLVKLTRLRSTEEEALADGKMAAEMERLRKLAASRK